MINVVKAIWQHDPELWGTNLAVYAGVVIVLTGFYSFLYIVSIIVESIFA